MSIPPPAYPARDDLALQGQLTVSHRAVRDLCTEACETFAPDGARPSHGRAGFN